MATRKIVVREIGTVKVSTKLDKAIVTYQHRGETKASALLRMYAEMSSIAGDLRHDEWSCYK